MNQKDPVLLDWSRKLIHFEFHCCRSRVVKISGARKFIRPQKLVVLAIRDCDCFTSHRTVERLSMSVSMTALPRRYAIGCKHSTKWCACSSESHLYPLPLLLRRWLNSLSSPFICDQSCRRDGRYAQISGSVDRIGWSNIVFLASYAQS